MKIKKKTEAETSRQTKVLRKENEGKRDRVVTGPKAKYNQAREDNILIRRKSIKKLGSTYIQGNRKKN